VDVVSALVFADGIALYPRPDVVPGVPLVFYGSQYPGGKAFNPAAFTPPPAGQQGDFGRNVLRGFGAWQADVAFQRQFHLTEKMALRFRGEFFNLFNHPNFGPPDNNLTDPSFGQSTQMLARSLGSGGANGGFQSALPGRRSALDPTGAQTCILSNSQFASRPLYAESISRSRENKRPTPR